MEEKRRWIERTLRRIRRRAEAGAGVRLEDGGIGAVPGRATSRCACAWSRGGCARTWRCGATSCTWRCGEPGRATALRDALERWYRRRARAEVAPRLDAAVRRAGTGYKRLSIRGQRTRWASCSSSGAMSFNWRLLLAPPRRSSTTWSSTRWPTSRCSTTRSASGALVARRSPALPRPRALAAAARPRAPLLAPMVVRGPRFSLRYLVAARRAGAVRARQRPGRHALLLLGPVHGGDARRARSSSRSTPSASGGERLELAIVGRGRPADRHHRLERLLAPRPARRGGHLARPRALGQRREPRVEGAGARRSRSGRSA